MKRILIFVALTIWMNIVKIEGGIPGNDCTIGDTPEARTGNSPTPGAKEIWIPNADKTFNTPGKVVAFTLYVNKKNVVVHLDIWRHNSGEADFELVGSVPFTPKVKGYHTIYLNPSEQIQVTSGDTVGFHYFGNNNPIDYRHGSCSRANELFRSLGGSESVAVGSVKGFNEPNRCGYFSIQAHKECPDQVPCEVGYPVRERIKNGPTPGNKEIWIPNYTKEFQADGKVTSFSIFVWKANREVFLDIWRPIESGKTYELVGFKAFTPTSKGPHTVSLTQAEEIHVKAGDTIGMHYLNGPALEYGAGGNCKAEGLVKTISTGPNIGAQGTFEGLGRCRWVSLKAFVYCPGSYGDPHFMLQSGGTNFCFNVHATNNQTFNLVSDKQNDIYVRGTTFEINPFETINPQSYFSEIAITAGKDYVVFTRDYFKANGKTYHYQMESQIEVGKISVFQGVGYQTTYHHVYVGDDITFVVSNADNSRVGKFLSVYILNRDGLSDDTSGILGQFMRTNFEVVNHESGKFMMSFSDKHDTVDVVRTSRYMPSVKEPVDCYYTHNIHELIGDKQLYIEDDILA